MGTVLIAGAVGTRVTFLMSRMLGKTNVPKKRMTDIKIVETIIKIKAGNGIEGKILSQAEAAPGGMVGIEVGRGDLGTRMEEAEAQDDIVIMIGMAGEGQLLALFRPGILGHRWTNAFVD